MDSGLIAHVFQNNLIWALLAMVAGNFVLAVLAAIMAKGDFELARLGDISKRVVIYVIPVLVLWGIAFYVPSWQVAATALYAVVMAALVARIAFNLGELGLPIPDEVLQHLKKVP
ncbi:MAG TPA: phage holin family protein [Dehalococcoidia bacterium]|nr:phage holin family protein [Dehalococcoidia bacterium]